MKYKTEKRTRMVPFTVDGTTNLVPETTTVRIPQAPRDWDRTAVTGAVVAVLLLTTIAVVWSTVSIGALLGGGVGLLAAVLFDLAWIVNILLEWLARNDEGKRRFPKGMGWALLIVTMGAIFWHGMLAGSVALAVVGALVSMVAKVLWMGIMRHVHRDVVDPKHKAWIAAERDKANAKIVLAQVNRQSARAEQAAALELMAAERIRQEYLELTPGTDTPDALSAPSLSASPATADDAMPSRRRDVTIPAETSGYPIEYASTLATDTATVHAIRPDVRPEPRTAPDAPEKDEERVPEQRPPSLASEVRRMVADGMTDASHIARALAQRVERQVDDPKYVATVKRYVREAAKQQPPVDGQGLYL